MRWMICVSVLLLSGFAWNAFAEEGKPLEIPIWPGVAPGSEDWTQKEVAYANAWDHKQMIRNVTKPTLTAFFADPAKSTGTAVVIAPGGGFRFHSWENEGTAVAQWLASRGVSAFVLKYRLLNTGESQELFEKGQEPKGAAIDIVALGAADGRQAIKVVRQHATEWKIDSDRIGILGFSAGGSVTMGVVMEHDAQSKPNFAAPIYGPGKPGAVAEDAPPLFIVCAGDDKGAANGSVKLYTDWKAAGRPAELHMYSTGGHGFGMSKRGLPIDHWIDRFTEWLEVQGLMRSKAATQQAKEPTANTMAIHKGAGGNVLITVSSPRPFPTINSAAVLYVGTEKSCSSRYAPGGAQTTLIFQMTPDEFAKVKVGDRVAVRYDPDSQEEWDFGQVGKKDLEN